MSALPISATVFTLLLVGGTSANYATNNPLRVCADPNNLPYSNDRREGFENRLAELVARDLGRDGVHYTWWAQRRGFLRNTLNVAACDVVMGIPSSADAALTTRPVLPILVCVCIARRSASGTGVTRRPTASTHAHWRSACR